MTSSSMRNLCLFVPIETGVFLITIFGLLNKLSGFYGLISLDYSHPLVVCTHVYSLVALIIFGFGLYGITKKHYKMVKWYTFFYWIDMLVSTTTTIIFSIQWFVFTDHSLPELADQPEKLREHDSSFNSEKIVSIVILCLLRIIHVYFACIMTAYASSLGKSHYSKLASDIDEELNFPGYDEMADVNDHTESDHVRLLSKNQ